MFIEEMCPHDFDEYVHKICGNKNCYAIITKYDYGTYLRVEDNLYGPKFTFQIGDFSIMPASELAISNPETLEFVNQSWKTHLAKLFGKRYIEEYKKYINNEINYLNREIEK